MATALCLAAVTLGGCFGGRSGPPERAPAVRIQFSPNAEPLSGGPLGQPKCEDALSGWFDRVDANHDGTIDRDEFLADARLQFNRMDRHHAGYVTAADLSEFRAPYEPPQAAEGPADGQYGDQRASDGSSGRRSSQGGVGGMFGGRSSQQRGLSVDTRADPVMSADKTLSFKVTSEEFIAQANDLFNGLDHNHDGRLTRDTVLGSCVKVK
ncbi:MAG TPA: hypothetical protein VN809_16955 [Telmatospirillum sp.]|nr:hypothetical protein [Telmatospirillum sp.]